MVENESKKEWVDKVMNSYAGIRKAKPNVSLLNSIELKIATLKSKSICIGRLKTIAAAAAILIGFNIIVMMQYNNVQTNNEFTMELADENVLISSYKIYE